MAVGRGSGGFRESRCRRFHLANAFVRSCSCCRAVPCLARTLSRHRKRRRTDPRLVAAPGSALRLFAESRSTTARSPFLGPSAPALPDVLSSSGSSTLFSAADEGEEEEEEEAAALRTAEKATQAKYTIRERIREAGPAAGSPVPEPTAPRAAIRPGVVFADGTGDTVSFSPFLLIGEWWATGSTWGSKSRARSGAGSVSGEPSSKPAAMLEPEAPALSTSPKASGAASANAVTSLALPASAALCAFKRKRRGGGYAVKCLDSSRRPGTVGNVQEM